MDKETLYEQELAPWFESLKQLDTTRPAQQMEQGRQRFLEQAQSLPPAVSSRPFQRLNGWMITLQNAWKRKELRPMLSTIATILVVASLALGGGGVTLAAAQYSQPDQALYGLKLTSENLRLQLAQGDTAEQAALMVQFALRRITEVQTMLQNGKTPPQALLTRTQTQLDTALRQCAALSDEQAQPLLQQLRTRLQEQLQSQQRLQVNDPAAQAVLNQLQQMVQQRLRLLEQTDGNLLQLRIQLQLQTQTQQQQNAPVNPAPGNPAPGTGGNPAPGTGGNTSPGTGGNTAPGTGGNTSPGTGGNTAPGTGGNTSPGTGGNTDPGSGGNNPGSGGSTDPGSGGNNPGSGGSTDPGSGGNNPGSGGSTDPGSGGNNPGSGGSTNPSPGTGGDTTPGGGSGSGGK